MTTTTEKFGFENQFGHRLSGRLERPSIVPTRAVALFAHCFTCTKNSRAAVRISAALASQGIATLRFDFTGLGSSEGEFAESGFASNVSDLVSASRALEGAVGAPSVLIGHSLGGAAVIAAADQISSVKAVVTIGAPFEVEHVLGQLGDDLAAVQKNGQAEVHIGGRPFVVDKGFVEQVYDQPQAERLKTLNKALLVMHAPHDDIVALENASAIFQAARHPKNFISLDRADHLLTNDRQAENVAAMIAAWATSYLPEFDEAEEPLPAGLVSVETAGGKFRQLVKCGSHRILADEPSTIGGGDLGPTPYDLLLASLGTCTSMTIKMYADRKGIPLEQVHIELEHSREHHDDCATCNNAQNRIDVIDRTITLKGNLSEEDQRKLMEIADKCPVHRTLENRIDIHSTAG
ncbi:MAG: bifunctional alpha/beta hydrolase/OsmC family protein [Pseudomonadota bacterium]